MIQQRATKLKRVKIAMRRRTVVITKIWVIVAVIRKSFFQLYKNTCNGCANTINTTLPHALAGVNGVLIPSRTHRFVEHRHHDARTQHHMPTSFSIPQHKANRMTTTDNRTDNTNENKVRRVWLWALILMGFGSVGVAQPTLSVQASLEAYAMVDRWVRDWEMPTSDQADVQSEIQSVAMSAVIVTLRLDGRVFGRGSSVSLDPSTMLVYQATKQAMRDANSKLTQDRDAMWDTYIAELAAKLTITIEVADVLVPMSESEIASPGFGYTPGVLGIVVRRGEELEILGPESMLARNTDMTQSAMALANALAGDGSAMLREPEQLAQSGYSFYRFEPVVLAQPGVSQGAAFIDRGGRVVNESEISIRSIEGLSAKIAGHLMNRRWAGVEHYGMMGTLDPVTGISESAFASPFDQAISAYALLRFGESGESKLHRQAHGFAKSVLGDLAIVEENEVAAWDDPVGACMAVIALGELPLVDILGDKALNTLRTRCIETLDGLYSESGGFDEALPMGSQGLVVHALVRASKLDPRNRTKAAASALGDVFESTLASGLVGQMPFLGWAAIEQGGDEEEFVGKPALYNMRSLVWEHQLARSDLAWMDRDLEGGIVFTSSSTPLPSWIGTKPMAMIATMLGDERFTPGTISSGQVPIQIGHQIDAIRFIRQLCADVENMHLYAAHSGAQWGVRKAMWDQRMPVEADAMALLTLIETTRSFDVIMSKAQR